MIDWATDLIDRIGLLGVGFLVALESVFPPIPSELVLLLSGFNVDSGRFGLVGAVVAATIGSVVGAWLLYLLGAWIDETRLERLLAGAGRYLGLTRADVATGFRWFDRHGPKVVFFGRLLPVVRSVVSIPAGANRMPPLQFTLLTAAGSFAWNCIWIVVGQALGDQWHKADEWSGVVEKVVLAAALIGGVVLVIRARRQRVELGDSGPDDLPEDLADEIA